jgi:hypothetical protein
LAVLCHFQNPTGPEQLQQAADRAHQSPLALNIVFATQAEVAKTALFLDLSEYWLDDGLASFGDVPGDDGSPIVCITPLCLSRPVAT